MASEPNIYHFDEVAKHKDGYDCWLIIHGKVYDVTHFLEEHPGGDEVLIAATGKDATDDFDDVGQSSSAKELMNKYCIGDIDVKRAPPPGKKYSPRVDPPKAINKNHAILAKLLQFLLPHLILGGAFSLRSTFKKE
ncbi:hypothetical protein P3X46_003578 [Hevea brasiliensis]|uniref:Cytochrome b5 heme-binding domain-containing protein n=1 Tax=Hevea brasiliensis TaxID=3981 RepID=A0ABQ9N7F3_HEVBR|nr:cytochrome b5-like [Hevea brasiliensis]XP_057986429.1 cytochrome b5-like [Hevea brasiliensis]XP_057986433.1 cytochrome b5-like [Hevea brasiliensis]XP_057986436.1 cytochrome b5-like [Hevea brasiliensis]KAJ9188191.1 hypothetical protein P3X46_003578 [Hevea brasiliensis]KAJ9188192.1 hypothetical protein P3X46_003578 [Hevea brasiliensis]KAJ9188193.1 hypothetical protein P3X46_003578 [Hevea brasiliensis]